MFSVKTKMIEIIRQQPEDSCYDDILHQLAEARKLRRGYIESGSSRRFEKPAARRPIRLWT